MSKLVVMTSDLPGSRDCQRNVKSNIDKTVSYREVEVGEQECHWRLQQYRAPPWGNIWEMEIDAGLNLPTVRPGLAIDLTPSFNELPFMRAI